MLVLSRRIGQEIVVGENVMVKILGVRGKRVCLGFRAPSEISVRREELAPLIETRPRQAAVGSEPCPRPRLLVAEDHDEFRRLLSDSFRQRDYDVTECRNGLELIENLRHVFDDTDSQRPFDLIISDIRMPGVTGVSVLAGLRQFYPSPPMILITAFGDEPTHAEARQLGAAATFDKPLDIQVLIDKADELLANAA